MEASGKFLIARVETGETLAGTPVAHLYSSDTRLRYPVLVLFDISMLESVGIDPNSLSEPIYTRFWAHYSESDKLTGSGKPYKDVVYLEPIDSPATSSSIDGAALLTELRAIKHILLSWAQGNPVTKTPDVPAPQPTPSVPETPPPDGNGQKEAKQAATNGQPEATPGAGARARAEFYQLASTAVPAGQVGFERVNAIVDQTANGAGGWSEALITLTNEIDNG